MRFLFLLVAVPVLAQVSGSISGSIVDASGAPVPAAQIQVYPEGSTAAVARVESTRYGVFTLPAIPAGFYDLAVSAPGFARYTAASLKVDPAQETSLAPIRLEVATLKDAVEVAATFAGVETVSAQASTTVGTEQLERLPLQDRNPLIALNTQAGVGHGVINGQRASFTNIVLDGVSINDEYFRGSSLTAFSGRMLLGQVSEATIITSNAAPRFAGASQIDFVTPSGGNIFHGSVYWNNRNTALASNSWSNNQRGFAKSQLNQNQAGFTLGGPILRNKFQFYSNYEAIRRRQYFFANKVILTPDARNGVFTYLDTAGVVQKVNILNAAGIGIDSRIKPLLDAVPGGDRIDNYNVGDSRAGLLRNTGGFSQPVSNNFDADNAIVKLDYILSPTNMLSGSYLWDHNYLENPGSSGYAVTPLATSRGAQQLMSLGWRSAPSLKLANELRAGVALSPGTTSTSQQYGGYIITGTLFTNPVPAVWPGGRNTSNFDYSDHLSYLRGRHGFAAGFDGHMVRSRVFSYFGTVPQYGLAIGAGNPGLTSAQLPGIRPSDLGPANMLLATLGGFVNSYSENFNITSRTSGFVAGAPSQRNFRMNNYGFYIEDSWRLRRLAITVGVRWDMYGVIDERDSLVLLPQLVNGDPLATLRSNATLDFAGSAAGRPWYRPDRNNFAPNVGAAWDVFGNGQTALRAGYSVHFVNDQNILASDSTLDIFANAGLSAVSSRAGLSGNISAGLPPVPLPVYKVPRTLADNYQIDPQTALGLIDPNLRTPYVQEWNAAVEQRVRGGFVLEARYVGSHAVKLWRDMNLNQVGIVQNGFLADFMRASSNGYLSRAATGVFSPAYNASISGSQPLTIFPLLANGGNLANGTVLALIQTGQPGQLGSFYQQQRQNGTVSFLPNPYAGATYLLTNQASASYNAVQVEARRRSRRGASVQVNYTFSKSLSDASDAANRLDTPVDVYNARIGRARTLFDFTHAIKANGVWEMPFGAGHWLNSPKMRRVLEGWALSGILIRESGAPFSVLSTRGTFTAASGMNTATSLLTKSQLDALLGFRMTGSGPYYVAASAIGPDGRAVTPDGSAPFRGQAFFHPGPGSTGTLQQRMFSGPWTFNLDARLSKQTRITERQSVGLSIDAFNVLNHPTWVMPDQVLDSTGFGRLSSTGNSRLVQLSAWYVF